MSSLAEVLVLDDEAIVCERLKEHLDKMGFAVEIFTESQKAIDRLGQKAFDVVVTDLKMKGPSGLDVMHFVRENRPGTQVIIITGYASMDAAREAEYSGVIGFVTKPFQLPKVGALVKKAAKKAARRKGGSEQ
jgi:DNA-binding NtrC family response regulator